MINNNKKLKIIFVGIPDMAIVCLANLAQKFNIAGVIPPEKSHETYKFFKDFVQGLNLNLIEFEKTPDECIDRIKELDADIGVVCSYNKKFSPEFLTSTRLGYINCHPSLLPYYRGAMPYFHIINNGEKYSGITLHFMDDDFDTGDIIYQKRFTLMPYETMGTLFNRTNYMISDALDEVLSNIENGIELKRTPQPKDKTYITADKTDGNFKIRFHHSIYELDRLIRACNPFFCAFTSFRGVTLKILMADVIEKKHKYEFGQIVRSNDDELLISANGGFLSLKVFQIGTYGTFNPKTFKYVFNSKSDEFLT